ncbi:MAG: glycosyltransferase [Algoriphagus sp.]|nr:glycosyltransferase [Algoriphagus sp.]
MNTSDKVTIICIAFNHQDWIEETLESVKMQDYYAKELIIVDNGSEDETKEIIKKWVNQSSGRLSVQTVFYEETQPYCQLFNDMLAKVNSQFVVDLSGDDVLYPDHLSKSVEVLRLDPKAAFVFSDAYILESEGIVKTFYRRSIGGELEEEIELGTIYETLIRSNLICSPTIVFNAPILIKEGGYDSSLYYEDFDIQLRLARTYPILFSNHIGVLKRKHSKSLSASQYQRYQSKMLPSTVAVCRKIQQMNRQDSENKALGIRILYELKHGLWSANFQAAEDLITIGNDIKLKGLKFLLFKFWAKRRWDISWLYVKIT